MRRTTIVGVCVLLAVCSARAQIPASIIDFDRSVGFSTPRNIIVYPAFGDNLQVYLVPNSIQVASVNSRENVVGLIHTGTLHEGTLILRLVPAIDGVPLPEIISDLKTQFPALKFSYPALKSSRFEVSGPGFYDVANDRKSFSDPIASDLVQTIKLPPLAVRALLAPRSYQLPVIAVSIEYTLRGMSRDATGKPGMDDRTFRISTTIQGFCALSPGSALDANRAKSGCINPSYDRALVMSLQKLLRAKGTYAGPIDGAYGEKTDIAIRNFQRMNRLPIDGIPSLALLEFMQPLQPKSKAGFSASK